MLTLALLLAAALLSDLASAQDKTAGTDLDRRDASQSEIRLGMSADLIFVPLCGPVGVCSGQHIKRISGPVIQNYVTRR
jgi:hypothetical protein